MMERLRRRWGKKRYAHRVLRVALNCIACDPVVGRKQKRHSFENQREKPIGNEAGFKRDRKRSANSAGVSSIVDIPNVHKKRSRKLRFRATAYGTRTPEPNGTVENKITGEMIGGLTWVPLGKTPVVYIYKNK